MVVPLLLGSDKILASNTTGQNKFHPLYLSLGNIKNAVCRTHRDAVVPIGFLAIPKSFFFFSVFRWFRSVLTWSPLGTRKDRTSTLFRLFRRQLLHQSLKVILSSLLPYMTKLDVVMCPDSHYRRVVYTLGPYIADYPEQVLLAAIVSGWCTR